MQNNTNKLAVISLVINAFLVIAVIILFVKMPSGNGEAEAGEPVDTTDMTKLHEKGQGAVIVHYNPDSLNTRCKFVMDVQKEITDAQINAETQLKTKQDQMVSWDKKWQAKGPLISTEQEQYMKEGEKLQMELMELQQKLEQELYETQTRLTTTAVTRISGYCRDLALKNGYDYVVGNQFGGQFMFCNPKMDITDELIDLMNADYAPADSSNPAEAETAQ